MEIRRLLKFGDDALRSKGLIGAEYENARVCEEFSLK